MKKIFMLLFIPLLMATQCDEDEDENPFFSTEFIVQNDSSKDLIFVTIENREFIIESSTSQFIAVSTISDRVQLPSENLTSNSNGIELYQRDLDNNLVIVYEQNPINDTLWTLNELSEFNFEYIFSITDDDLID